MVDEDKILKEVERLRATESRNGSFATTHEERKDWFISFYCGHVFQAKERGTALNEAEEVHLLGIQRLWSLTDEEVVELKKMGDERVLRGEAMVELLESERSGKPILIH